MPVVEPQVAEVALTDADSTLTDVVGRLDEYPTRAVALTRGVGTAAVLLHPAAFDALVAAAAGAGDLVAAEEALASEPLESFADYHAQRLARRQRRKP